MSYHALRCYVAVLESYTPHESLQVTTTRYAVISTVFRLTPVGYSP